MKSLLQQIEENIGNIRNGTAKKSEIIEALETVKSLLADGQVVDPVSRAAGTLTMSEQQAIQALFDEIPDAGGTIVASKVADKAGLTRSVIVSALRKFESAGVIGTRSLGMKGTNVKPLVANGITRIRAAVA